MKKLLYIIIPIGILAVLNILTDEQYIVVGWIFTGIWIIKIFLKPLLLFKNHILNTNNNN